MDWNSKDKKSKIDKWLEPFLWILLLVFAIIFFAMIGAGLALAEEEYAMNLPVIAAGPSPTPTPWPGIYPPNRCTYCHPYSQMGSVPEHWRDNYPYPPRCGYCHGCSVPHQKG